MKLEAENVRFIEAQLIDDLTLSDVTDRWAVKTLAYIDGVHTMANAIIEAIQELKKDLTVQVAPLQMDKVEQS